MNETTIFEQFIAEKKLRHSQQREWILTVFLGIEKHVTVDELWREVRSVHPEVGSATVYRTLRLLCECGLCRELRFDDGATRYEHLYGHEHHDHLICTKCGISVEVVNPEIEHLQEQLMIRHGFVPQRHRMELYGICSACAKR
jgi:Fur family transcriptional regulator, ferric uptake regulator